jgi:DNA phosphorothioation system restriction enzyme
MSKRTGLAELDLLPAYRSGRNSLISEFYVPCLSVCTRYDRAVGFFTSTSLSVAAKGLSRLIGNGGTMRLIASPSLSEEDAAAIKEGYRKREQIFERALLRELDEHRVIDNITKKRLGFLAWLIQEERIDIKIAVVEDEQGIGVYHEKIGVFHDSEGESVTFTGSANESSSGLVSNFESIHVFRSWLPEDFSRAKLISQDFDDLWDNVTPGLKLYPFPEAVKKQLLRLRPVQVPTLEPEEVQAKEEITPAGPQPLSLGTPDIPKSIEVRPYQRDAVQKWFLNKGRGIFQMATGTGKTITALALMTQLFRAMKKERRPLTVFVLCPYKHLVSQWAEEGTRFGVHALQCMGSRTLWHQSLVELLAAQKTGSLPFLLVLTTNSTFSGDAFQDIVSSISNDLLLIADEAHNLGAEELRNLLPDQAEFRLGLSATPERWFDDIGTQALYDYFGDPIVKLSLADAIKQGALTRYRYFVHTVELEEDEAEAYFEITKKIAVLTASGGQTLTDDSTGASQALKLLLLKRARLVASARQKLVVLKRVLLPIKASTHNLFYCGDGTVETTDGETQRQLEAVTRLLGIELGMAVDSYTSETSIEDRADLRTRFGAGELNGLVAIRCLDEGVDIPATRRAFILASSTNPRQFIQRRGRVLRKYPGKDEAEVHDFVVIPQSQTWDPAVFNVERNLFRRELIRIVEFAHLAENGDEVMISLLPLRKRFNVLDL